MSCLYPGEQHGAILSALIDVVKALIKTKHWDPNSSCNSRGDRALHLSAKYNRHEVVHYLLSEAKCDPNSKNLKNEAPLQLVMPS